MIVNDRVVSYIQSLEKGNSAICEEIEKYALETFVPIIRKEMESFLKVILTIKQPKHILEIGTGIGYSAILMSENINDEATITTIENYEKRIEIAQNNIIKYKMKDKIKLMKGDALEILPTINQQFDFIFMDAAKAQYINFLPHVLRLLKKDGILLSDNVLQDGDIIESRFAITRRNRTIHSRMREYLYTIKNNSELETTIIPIGDGITLSVKK